MKPSQWFRIKPADNKRLLAFYSARRDLAEFFGTNIPMPHVFIVSSRRDIDTMFGRKTERWIIAWVKNGNIFALDPAAYRKESNHRDPRHFGKILKHEYSHLYFEKLTGTNSPKWLNEGLACYLAKQKKSLPSTSWALKVPHYYRKSDQWIYAVGYFWVDLLVKKFGKAKLLKLIKGVRVNMTRREFESHFRGIYDVRFNRQGLKALLLTSR